MKDTIRRLIIVHLSVVALSVLLSFFLWGATGSVSTLVGALTFSLPVIIFSYQVLRASAGSPSRFWGRFMMAEVMKWVSSGVLLALAFVTGVFQAQPLLAGFLLSVVVQVFFPIFVRKESQT